MDNKVPVYQIIRNIATKGKEYEAEIRDWLNETDENKKIYQDLLNIWQVTGTFPDRFSPDRPEAWKKVRKQIHAQKQIRFLYRRVAQIAAAIVVVLLSMWLGTELENWEQPVYSEIISPAGQKTRVILPDSSAVMLNGDSRIRYNHDFSRHNRIVELQGEGYFDVRQDLSRQFIVQTSGLSIKVYGTSFDVKAYSDDQAVEIGLKSGLVGIDHNEKEVARLVPGQMAIFNKDERKFDIRKMDMDVVSAWTRDELVFEENSLEEIVKCMERWYGVNIEVAPELYDGERYTFKVKTESLRELMELINMIKPVKYTIEGKHVMIIQP